MATIQTYDTDGSAQGRINAWRTAITLANDRVTGGGFEIYTPEIFAQYAPDPNNVKVAHSIYFSVLGEHGYMGLLLFLGLGWLAFRIGSQVRSRVADRPDAQWVHQLAQMCCLSLVGYAVGGAFLSLAYFDLPYNILVILLASQRWLGDVQPERAAAGALPSRGLPT